MAEEASLDYSLKGRSSDTKEESCEYERYHETVFVRTRQVAQKLEVPVSSLKRLPVAWEKVKLLKNLEREIYLDVYPDRLGYVLDYLAGYISQVPPISTGVYMVLMGTPVDHSKVNAKLPDLIRDVKLVIHAAIASIEGTPPLRTVLNLKLPPEVKELDASSRMALKRGINFESMDLAAPNGYVFPKNRRCFHVIASEIILRGPPERRPATRIKLQRAADGSIDAVMP
jgi:hypothetical protein